MRRALFLSWTIGLLLVASAAAFEVNAVIKRVDLGQRRLTIDTKQEQRTIPVPDDVKVFDTNGKELADGLKSAELKEGVRITLVVERAGDRPLLRQIRLGGAGSPPAAATPSVSQKPATDFKFPDTTDLIPITELGTREYQGFAGGLYPDGKNTRPASHEEAGLKLAAAIRPLDADGKSSPDGKVVLLGIGFSNTVQAFGGFMQVAKESDQIDPHVVLVNGAKGGMSAFRIQNPDDGGSGTQYWAHVDERLKAASVSRAQVQVVWIKETDPSPHAGGFPNYVKTLQDELTKITNVVQQRFPNVKLAYLSSRTYGGWAKPRPNGTAPGNSEPFSYQSGFAYKWLIESQLAGDPALNYDPAKGEVRAPWLSWSAYLWANPNHPRSDGVKFALEDFMETDQMHESPAGQRKVGAMLLDFFLHDSTACPWFARH